MKLKFGILLLMYLIILDNFKELKLLLVNLILIVLDLIVMDLLKLLI